MAADYLFVTGASGLLGSNVARIAAAQGRHVRGLVRQREDVDTLNALGVEAVLGDVTDPASLRDAMVGVEAVAHCAALIGGTWSTSTAENFESVNYQGSINVAEAAAAAGVRRTVMISTLALLDPAHTVTERSPLIELDGLTGGYQRAKAAAYYDGMRRAVRGTDLAFVFPGAMYGPSPFIARAVQPTLFTGTLLMALRGELTRYGRFPLTWPWVDDAALITLGAIDDDAIGVRYLAAGRSDDAMSLAEFCNLGCAIAEVPYRVADLSADEMGDELGTMRAFAQRQRASPPIDPSWTNLRLGIELTPVEVGIGRTVAWLREHRLF